MIQAMQLNAVWFDDRDQLLELIEKVIDDKLKESKWDRAWKAQLRLSRAPTEKGGSHDRPPYIFHVRVKNQHWRKAAQGCRPYLTEIYHVDTDVKFRTTSFELKWTGVKLPDATILPARYRAFDAFDIDPADPTKLRWRFSHADTDKVWTSIEEPGTYHLTYMVTSLNFWQAKAKFELVLKENISDTTLTPISYEVGPGI